MSLGKSKERIDKHLYFKSGSKICSYDINKTGTRIIIIDEYTQSDNT